MWEVKLKKFWSGNQVISENLKTIKGLNKKSISELLKSCGISEKSHIKEIRPRHLRILYEELTRLRRNNKIDDNFVEEFKKRWTDKLELGNWKARRHNNKYPVKGRTKCNGKSKKRWHTI